MSGVKRFPAKTKSLAQSQISFCKKYLVVMPSKYCTLIKAQIPITTKCIYCVIWWVFLKREQVLIIHNVMDKSKVKTAHFRTCFPVLFLTTLPMLYRMGSYPTQIRLMFSLRVQVHKSLQLVVLLMKLSLVLHLICILISNSMA